MRIFLFGLLFSGLLSLLYAAGELVVRPRAAKNWLLFGVFACLGVMLLHAYALLSGELARAPFLLGWHLPCFLALGPLLYRFILLRLGLAPDGRWWGHLVPAVLLAGLLLVFSGHELETRRNFILEFRGPEQAGWPLLLVWGSSLHFVGYVLLGGWRVASSVGWRAVRTEPMVRILYYILASAALIVLLVMAGLLSGGPGWLAVSLAVLGLLLPSLYLIRQRVPSFFRDLEVVVQKEKYRNSQLAHANLAQVERNLRRLMEEERVYREENLSLAVLARRVGLTPHQLSEYFNSRLKLNFAGYVNRYRVQEARQLLRAEPDLTVLAVAYRVGFNSKSSFNAAFARETGLSPTRYRKGA